MNPAAPDSGTVHVVDDDPAMRQALCRLLSAAGFTACAYASADDVLRTPAAQRCTAECFVLDMMLPGRSGLELQAALCDGEDPPPVLFLTGHGSVDTTVLAMRSGAVDVLTKPVQAERLLAAVDRALAADTQARQERRWRRELQQRHTQLTPREQQVLACVVQGQLNKQIAWDLGMAERTVKSHRAQVMLKMQANSVADLVRMCRDLPQGEAISGFAALAH